MQPAKPTIAELQRLRLGPFLFEYATNFEFEIPTVEEPTAGRFLQKG